MNYLTYEEYVVYFNGSICDEIAFSRNIDRACAMIDMRTNDRLHNPKLFYDYDGTMKLVKSCCADLVDYISKNTVIEKAVTSRSQTAGAVSESESYAVKSIDDFANDLDMIFEILNTVYTKNGFRLTYRGAMS